MVEDRGGWEIARARYLLGAASLSTGVALLVYFLAGVSLRLSAALTVAVALGSVRFVWSRQPIPVRRDLARRARAGLLAGIAATFAYDAGRLLLVRAADLSFRPFEAFSRFGELLVGPGASSSLVMLAGTAYHLANGLGFAVGYALVLGTRGWKAGLAWAMGLELLMVSFYPGWLGLRALDEFLTVTILGHVAYGVVLGAVSRKLLVPGANGPAAEVAR